MRGLKRTMSFRARLVAYWFALSSMLAAEPIKLVILESSVSAADPADIGIIFNSIFEKLSVSKGIEVAKVVRSEKSFFKAVRNKQANLMPMESFQYFRFADQVPLVPALVPLVDDSAHEQFVVLVHRDSAIRSLEDGVGGSVILDDRWTTPYVRYWLDKELNELDLPAAEQHFKQLVDAERAPQAVLSVFFKQHQMGVATKHAYESLCELNPQLKHDLVVVKESEPMLLFLVCASGYLSSDEREEIVSRASSSHEDPKVKQILMLSKIDRLAAYEEGLLGSVEDLWRYAESRSTNSEIATSPLEE